MKRLGTVGRETWLKENAKEWRRVLLQSEKNVFKLHGKIATTNSKSRVLAGGAYTICDMDGTYLEGTPFGPRYGISYMHEGAKETAWVFTLNPQSSLQETHSDFEPKAGVQFRVSDNNGKDLGMMRSLPLGTEKTPSCCSPASSGISVLYFEIEYVAEDTK